MEGMKTSEIVPALQLLFPPLRDHSRKGQNGRIGVIGGSSEFTGAPYYAAISALKAGGDLAHIFCSKSAAVAIKSYSPEIIVHPVFVSENEEKYDAEELEKAHCQWLERIGTWQRAIDSWVIGPGLGRDSYMNSFFPKLVKSLPSDSLVIFDADGLYFLSKHPDLLPELKRFRTVLTPNPNEVKHLKDIIQLDVQDLTAKHKSEEEIEEIPSSQKFRDFSVFVKGKEDIILTAKKSFIVRSKGGDKRCGGLGDIFAGVAAVYCAWSIDYGGVLAARVMKQATLRAYQKEGRGLTAPLVIAQLPRTVMEMESASL